jgi:hypothetical protein
MKIQDYIDQSHEDNKRWWMDPHTGELITRNKVEMLMLVVTEIAEAAEGIRKELLDDKLPNRLMEEVEIADALIRLFDYCGGHGIEVSIPDFDECEHLNSMAEVATSITGVCPGRKLVSLMNCVAYAVRLAEVADTPLEEERAGELIITLLSFAHQEGMDILGAYQEKREYNLTREDHTLHHRAQPGGKKL